MRDRAETPCQKLPAFLRDLLPVAALCALAGALLSWPAQAQTDDLARSTPVPDPPVVQAAGGPALPDARGDGLAVEALAAVGLAPAEADESLLARALDGSPRGGDGGSDLASLRDVLPHGLYRDVVELRDRVVRVRSRVFGRRGIVSLGRADEDGEVGRLRLNLQYSPDPGIRVTLITR